MRGILVFAVVAGVVLCRHPSPLGTVAALRACDSVVVGAEPGCFPRTVLNLPFHSVLIFRLEDLYHQNAYLALTVASVSPVAHFR